MVGGEGRESGFRGQESETTNQKSQIRNQKPEARMKSICFPPSAFSLLLTALSPRIRVLSRLQENKSMPMGEQIRDEINAPPRYDSKLQTRPALEAVNWRTRDSADSRLEC